MTHYQDDDQMLARIMREACPKAVYKPLYKPMKAADNSDAAKEERRAQNRHGHG